MSSLYILQQVQDEPKLEGSRFCASSGPDLTVVSTIFELWVVLRAAQTQQHSPNGRTGVDSSNLHTQNHGTLGTQI